MSTRTGYRGLNGWVKLPHLITQCYTLQVGKTRVCGGTKVSFILLNDPYRHPEDWETWDANISVITQRKIKGSWSVMVAML